MLIVGFCFVFFSFYDLRALLCSVAFVSRSTVHHSRSCWDLGFVIRCWVLIRGSWLPLLITTWTPTYPTISPHRTAPHLHLQPGIILRHLDARRYRQLQFFLAFVAPLCFPLDLEFVGAIGRWDALSDWLLWFFVFFGVSLVAVFFLVCDYCSDDTWRRMRIR